MSRREPEALRVGMQVGQPQRLRIEDQHPEDAVTFRVRTDPCRLLLVHTDGDELGEALARFVEHAQRGVPGIDEIGRGFGDAM